MTKINDPQIMAEVSQLYVQYETALCNNDIETLNTFFWDSPHVVRFGLMENLYGSDAIKSYRKSKTGLKLKRELSQLMITTFDTDTAIVTLEFFGGLIDKPGRSGRQTQVWQRLLDGWKIVSAHVLWLP